MTMTTVRRGVAGVLLLAQAACAAQGAGRTATAPHVTDADRERCGYLAADEETRDNALRKDDGGLAGLIFIGLMGGPAAALLLAPFVIVMANKDQWKAQARALDGRMSSCLAPILLAHEHGPDHPTVAAALAAVARRYVDVRQFEEAEALHARATAIAGRAGEVGLLADVLESRARALTMSGRPAEAAALEERARALRTTLAVPAGDEEPAGDAAPAGP